MLKSEVEPSFSQLIKEHPLKLAIPPKVLLELQKRGVMSTCNDDVRVAPRFRCKGPAVLEWIESPCGLPLQFPMMQVIVKNLSRTGFSLLADRQWFPEQTARIFFTSAISTAKVVRARRLDSHCYEVGFRIINFRNLET